MLEFRAKRAPHRRPKMLADEWKRVSVQRELRRGDVACVLAEAAVINTGVIQPAEGFHAGLRALASESGALLVLDETHTLGHSR
jgi:glutamate-1-semialdehyde aminotransferase